MWGWSKSTRVVIQSMLVGVIIAVAVAGTFLVTRQLLATSSPTNPTDSPVVATPRGTFITHIPTPTTHVSASSSPSPSTAASPAASPLAEVNQPLTQPAVPVVPTSPVPQRSQTTCPTGLVTAALSKISFTPANNGYDQSIISASGSVRNGTNAEILLFDNDVPDFQGLNNRGESVVIELFGKWDWAPPPGKPNLGFLTMQPGQSITYTITSTYFNSTINEVLNWYTAAEVGSLHASFNDSSYIRCPNPLSPAGRGASVPATNLPTVAP